MREQTTLCHPNTQRLFRALSLRMLLPLLAILVFSVLVFPERRLTVLVLGILLLLLEAAVLFDVATALFRVPDRPRTLRDLTRSGYWACAFRNTSVLVGASLGVPLHPIAGLTAAVMAYFLVRPLTIRLGVLMVTGAQPR